MLSGLISQLEGDDIGNWSAGHLVGEGVITRWQVAGVETVAQGGDPPLVKVMKEAGGNPSPIVNRHVTSPKGVALPRCSFYQTRGLRAVGNKISMSENGEI